MFLSASDSALNELNETMFKIRLAAAVPVHVSGESDLTEQQI